MFFGHGGFRIFRIFGIDIILDWSWIFIFLLVTWSLAMGIFPQWHPGWSPALNWGLAGAASLLFFLSILLHELAHSLVAKKRGMPVHEIILFLFGGVSNLEREPTSAATEFVMAIVGPLTSLALGVVFFLIGAWNVGGIYAVTHATVFTLAHMGPLATLLLWLGPINVLIGFFNLIPGFPLDGGRVLRSAIWGVTHNLRKSTIWAARVGQGIGWLFIAAGIAMVLGIRIPLLGSGLIGGLWLAFIGWFLRNAAISSSRQVVIEQTLDGITVARLMSADVHTVSEDTSVGSLVQNWMTGSDQRSFIVMDGEKMAGLVSLQDVRKLSRDRWDLTQVEEIMTPADKLVTAKPEEEASEALKDLTSRDLHQLPVMQDGRLIGVLRLSDMVKWVNVHQGA